MKKRVTCLGITVAMMVVSHISGAIVRQPTNSVDSFEVERAYRARSEQPDDVPVIKPPQETSRPQQSDNSNNIMQAERLKNPQDVSALQTVQRDIRMQNPWYRALRVVGGSLLALGISALVIWRLWLRLVSTQRNKMLEQMRRGQQLAKELRDKQQ